MSYLTQFPDFPADAMPMLPAGFMDRSWRNEACPSIIHEESGVVVWIGHPDPALREWDGGDVLQFHAFEAVRITPLGEAARPPLPSVERHATYRRSLNTRSAFVYQP